MGLRLYNTMARQQESFEPRATPVTLYVCGVTPYDTTHIGHARTYLIFDVLQRYLADQGMPVRYVQNVTDIDDPLFAKAHELGVGYRDLAAQCIDIFLNDLDALNIWRPAVYPHVSEEIPYIIETVETLFERDMAYATGGYAFFRAHRFPGYGAMSRLGTEEMKAAHRDTGEDPDLPLKEHPLDFRLWQPSQPDEPAWPTPWGEGRPGWHIECSTMASRHLGPSIDIHGGGEDLIFPHHCSEIAQSETATGQSPFVRYWMHVGLVRMNGEKMSKSRGNLAFVRDLTPKYGGDALRYYLLQFPYREQMDFVEDDLAEAAARWEAIARLGADGSEQPETSAGNEAWEACTAALDDDLDTPRALQALDQLADRTAAGRGDSAAVHAIAAMLGFQMDRPS